MKQLTKSKHKSTRYVVEKQRECFAWNPTRRVNVWRKVFHGYYAT
jgi:hypothetical protein